MTKFGTVTHVWEGRIIRGSATPPSQGAGPPALPQFLLECSIFAHTFWRRTIKFDVVIYMGRWLVLIGSATTLCPAFPNFGGTPFMTTPVNAERPRLAR